MVSGPITKNTSIYYKVRSPRKRLRQWEGCPRNPKGIRVGVILEDMYAELSKLHFIESQYADRVKNMRAYTDAKMDDDILARKRSVQAEKNNKHAK